MPEASSSFDCGEGVDGYESEDAFDWSRDEAEGEGMGVVFFPCLDVEGQECCEQS